MISKEEKNVELTANVNVRNIKEFEDHVNKAQLLLEELKIELNNIRDFKFCIENNLNGCL